MGDHTADRRADFGRPLRFGLHAVDLAAHPFVEGGTQFRTVRAHFVQFGVDLGQHAASDRRTQGPADQAAALLPHTFLDG